MPARPRTGVDGEDDGMLSSSLSLFMRSFAEKLTERRDKVSLRTNLLGLEKRSARA